MARITKVWLSRTGDYENFSEGVKDADSFSLGVPTTNIPIWIDALEALLVGTTGDEWKVGTNKLDGAITPTNFSIKEQSNYGSANVQAVKVNEVLLFIDFVGRKVRELTYSEQRQKYVAPDLTALAEHITLAGVITNWAYQKNPNPRVWCVLSDGSLISMEYDREQNVVAWAKHPIDGTVMSVCVLPSTSEDEVYISIGRTVNSDENTYIEKLASQIPVTDISDCHYVDCAYVYDDVATNTVSVVDGNSYSFLEGETVSVLADGVAYEDLVIEGGVLTLPDAAEAEKIIIGIPYTAKVQPMRMDINTQSGSSHGSIKHIPELVLSLQNSKAIKYGDSTGELYDVDLTTPELINSSSVTGLFTGDVTIPFTSGFSIDDPIIVTSDAPLPMNLRAIIAREEVTGR